MTITAAGLAAGMHLAFTGAYVAVERVEHESSGIIRAYVRDAWGRLTSVVFHSAEALRVAA